MELAKFAKLKDEISSAKNIMQLRGLRDQFQQSTGHIEQLHGAYDIEQWNFHINDVHDTLIRKTVALAELRMVGEGFGPPPTSYSYLLLGSGGRSEQTLASDQDSALIYEDVLDNEEVKQYFIVFSGRVVEMLKQLGYPPCDGKVQSNELMWCQSETEWKDKLENWFTDASWESIRYLLICADARCISGNTQLFDSIRDYYKLGLFRHVTIMERMIDNTVQYKMLVGVFGQFITDRYGDHVGSIDVKYGAYIPIVNSIRWLALNNHVTSTSTLSRIDSLFDKEVISVSEYRQYREAFLQMLSLRLRAGHRMEAGYYEGYSKLNPKKLDSDEIRDLKKNLKIGKEIQRHVLREFGRLK
ncbi:DUF294 nucleotidyltransferase-like domain-containing protein [Paenibacillus endoradicis]|uniref:DUF294 nucleotidyltransferase-like domain-containing protein n=1 Tax=Paenibacillus endoradicis TaxID=2972487 RepID=UPI002158B9B4|nr:DUF294 nucleotidyltransferase-like domain-containing protein [Paenibacillus endoradicis]MCR8659135.1 DUF294 nucleotidyltransferase-like domain-containing protein [Paenibacillus endoradicis]